VDKDQKLRIGPDVAFRVIDGKAILVNVRSNRMIVLNETGAFLWQRVDGATPQDLEAAFAEVFPDARAAIPDDVERFLLSLVDHDLVRWE
jgi:hypothetical protein